MLKPVFARQDQLQRVMSCWVGGGQAFSRKQSSFGAALPVGDVPRALLPPDLLFLLQATSSYVPDSRLRGCGCFHELRQATSQAQQPVPVRPHY